MCASKFEATKVVVSSSTIKAGPEITSPGMRSARRWISAETFSPRESIISETDMFFTCRPRSAGGQARAFGSGACRDNDRSQAELLRQARSMQGRRAAEGNHRPFGQILAALDPMDSRGIGHILFDDLGNRQGGTLAVEAERFADMLINGGCRGLFVEPHPAAGEMVGTNAAEHDICI